MAEKTTVKLKALAELRTGATIAAVCKKYALHRNTVSGWKREAAIIPGDLAPAVTTAIERKTIDELAELGMPKRRALEILIQGMTEPAMTQFEGKGDQMIATPSKDYKIILGYLRDYLKLIDAYPAEKSEVQVKTVVINITEKLLGAISKYVPEDKRPALAAEAEAIFKEAGE